MKLSDYLTMHKICAAAQARFGVNTVPVRGEVGRKPELRARQIASWIAHTAGHDAGDIAAHFGQTRAAINYQRRIVSDTPTKAVDAIMLLAGMVALLDVSRPPLRHPLTNGAAGTPAPAPAKASDYYDATARLLGTGLTSADVARRRAAVKKRLG